MQSTIIILLCLRGCEYDIAVHAISWRQGEFSHAEPGLDRYTFVMALPPDPIGGCTMPEGEMAGLGVNQDDGRQTLSEPSTSKKLLHLTSLGTSPFLTNNIKGSAVRIDEQVLFDFTAMVATKYADGVERSHTATQFMPGRHRQTERLLGVSPRAEGVKVWTGFCHAYGDRPKFPAGGEREND